MKVANDISLSDTEKSKAFLLKQGAILTQDNIEKLSNFNISLGKFLKLSYILPT